MTNHTQWKVSKHPLWRGDRRDGITPPTPTADASLVRHILYLEGPGRETPYLSNTEQREVAQRFAGRDGEVWQTLVREAQARGVKHLSRHELLSLLKGLGKGKARWHSAYEVLQARRYVEEWAEHLLDFSEIADPSIILPDLYQAS
jgi:hypothetical protein